MPGLIPRLTPCLTEDETRDFFLAACRSEVAALKPGNVHIHAAGHGMETAHFEAAAAAAAPWIADHALNVGVRVQCAVEASMAAAGLNTNLGILLLAAPLAVAAEHGSGATFRESLATVLANLDDVDAAAVYAAIRRANPGGLGTAPEQDVREGPTVTLRAAMALAAPRDRIAHAYIDDFCEVFEFGLPVLARAHQEAKDAADPSIEVTSLHMAYLAQKSDTHIARKFGQQTADAVQHEAQSLRRLWDPAARPESLPGLLAFDKALKTRGLNPGTTADFVVATLFARSICQRLGRGGTGSPLSNEGASR